MKLIINADDFGLSKSITDGIVDGIKAGAITSTSIMANMEFADYAIEQAKKNNIKCVGLHINLTVGKPLTNCPSLCDENGIFIYGKQQQENICAAESEIRKEISAQVNFVESRGLKLDHINNHHSLKNNPIMCKVFVETAKEMNLPMRNYSVALQKEMCIKTPDIFVEDFMNANATKETLIEIIKKYKDTNQIIEVVTHSGYIDDCTKTVTSYQTRDTELQNLIELKSDGIFDDVELINFADLANMEFFAMYDENKNHIGVWPKSRAHSPDAGAYHKPVHVWIVNAAGGGQVLVQKRAACKKLHPNKWDIPSAGHVNAGEQLLDACVRETWEELGITFPKSAFKFQCETVSTLGWEFQQHYLVKDSTKIKDMTPDPREVAEVKWLSLADFEKLLYSDEFVAHSKDYKDTVLKFIKRALGN